MLDERLETIFYYMQTKRFAIYKMTKFVPPIDSIQSEEMQIMYGIYFNSLISLIEYIKNEFKQQDIINICYQLYGSQNNYMYIRELRNSIIHRGLNVANAGTKLVKFNIVVPFAPIEVINQSGQRIYTKFVDNLFQLVALCEQINSYIYQICSKLNLLEYKPMTKELREKRIEEDPFIPQYAKKMSKNCELDYNEINSNLKRIHEERIKKYFNTNDLFPN